MAPLGRRLFCTLLSGTSGFAVVSGSAFGGSARTESALAAPMDANGPTLDVAGPPDSEAANWAALLQPALAAGVGARGGGAARVRLLGVRYMGGRDGVTGTNMFDARATPDGQTALLFPGAAPLAWLVGDSRVRFDAGHFDPLLSALTSGALCVRGGAAALAGGRALRLGCDAAVAPALTALMALHLIGTPAVPVLAAPDCVAAAQRGELDAVFAHGLSLPQQLRSLAAAGLPPVYAVRFPRAALAAGAVADLPDLEGALGRVLPPNDARLAAWRAVAAASLLEVALALPRLCPAGAVARWQGACDHAAAAPAIAATLPATVRLLTGTDASASLSAVMADADAQLALRRWMADRLNWHPT